MSLSANYPVTLVCQVLNLSASTYYYRRQKQDESDLKNNLLDVAGQWPTYGSRRLAKQMQRQGQLLGRQRTRRLMVELGIKARQKRRKRQTTQSNHHFARYSNLVAGLDIIRSDQVWVADITYIPYRSKTPSEPIYSRG